MTNLYLKSLAGAAMLVIASGHVASADPDGTCHDYSSEQIAAAQDGAPGAAPQSPLDRTKIAQLVSAAGNSATDADYTPRPDIAKKQTDALPKDR